jgi:hypothetical protein
VGGEGRNTCVTVGSGKLKGCRVGAIDTEPRFDFLQSDLVLGKQPPGESYLLMGDTRLF